jgi:hypothetical protein
MGNESLLKKTEEPSEPPSRQKNNKRRLSWYINEKRDCPSPFDFINTETTYQTTMDWKWEEY